ncbi:hypothetical protein E4U42_004607 [Claviceps africana]|uniref:DUF2470 domain-containing protein n=1 Tax=Claviceps africana TaxID=83212 RepID=A0A8K0J7S0_9HYPO|nr:hypothetical protein E4U42_004607 [Claviceps africana]
MAATPGGDEAIRDRTITHMNQLHTRELTHYLRHYCGLTKRQSAGASLRDLTLQGMRIRAGGADHVVDFDPPLPSWNHVRPRVIEMDAVARQSLGISDIYMDKYHLPSSADLSVMLAVAFYFLSVASLPCITPGSPLWRLLSACFPGGPETFRWQVKILLLPVLGIHTAESLYLDLSRLRKHGVDRWSAQWWMWIVSCFFEGIMAFRRFDRVIARKKAEKEAKKH